MKQYKPQQGERYQKPTISDIKAKKLQDIEDEFQFYKSLMSREKITLCKIRGRWRQSRMKGVVK